MKLSDFRTGIALLTQQELANLSEVAPSTIYLIEHGKPFTKLSKGKILHGLSLKLGREVLPEEIDEFKE